MEVNQACHRIARSLPAFGYRKMNIYDYIVLAIVAAALICAVVFMIKRRKNGGGCCGSGSCGNCPMSGSCPKHTDSDRKKQ